LVLSVLLLATLALAACGGPTSESWAGLATDAQASTLYVATGKHVLALNPASGAVLWEYKIGDAAFYAPPVVSDGVIYVGDYSGRLHALNSDGTLRWRYTLPKQAILGPLEITPKDRVIGSVAVDSDKVYFGLGSRNVVAVSQQTGQEVWTFGTGHGVWARPLYLPADPSATHRGAVLYVVSLDHHLYALDAETGKELWRKDVGGAAPGTPVYDPARQRLYVGTFASELLAVSLETREIVDRFETDGWLWGSPAFDGNVLYFGDLSGALYAVRVTDEGFQQVWKKPVAEDGIRATPILTDGLVIVASKDHNLYAVSKEDGASQWYKDVKGEVLADLVFVPGADDNTPDLVIASTMDNDRLVVALNVENGEEAWTYSD
jgi:outer membrane protein assembly factor BamB